MKVLNPENSSSLLDVGCGVGILFNQLLALNRELKLTGIDISPEMIQRAKAKFQNNKNVTFLVGSANRLPYKDNTFDYVACATSFHHHPNSEQSLKERIRVLKRGGKFILLDGLSEGILRKIAFKLDQIINKEGTVYRYSKKEMYNLFQKAGFKDIELQTRWYFDLITTGTKGK